MSDYQNLNEHASTGEGPPTFYLHRYVLDQMVTDAAIPVVKMQMDEMRREFNRVKADRGWPDDAKPLWKIGWEYKEPWPCAQADVAPSIAERMQRIWRRWVTG